MVTVGRAELSKPRSRCTEPRTCCCKEAKFAAARTRGMSKAKAKCLDGFEEGITDDPESSMKVVKYGGRWALFGYSSCCESRHRSLGDGHQCGSLVGRPT
jgi:hypothetical protein